MLAEKEALLVARLEEFGHSELLTSEFCLNHDQDAALRQSSPVESTLIARLRVGEMEAFDQLVEEFQSLVYALTLRILNNAEDARDATQETFLKVYRHFGKFRGDASLKTWICRIGINQARSADRWLRRRRRNDTTSIDAPCGPSHTANGGVNGYDQRSPIDYLQSRYATPEDETLSHERSRQLERGLRQLKKDFRIAVILRDIEGLSYEEIAWVTEVSVGTVKSRIARGREMLRETIKAGERELGFGSHHSS
ncbi:MAG: sigma-70 family RNA polymerase sigma factor [Chloracidobacterium sp.]|nr:sigma-70 family RNA polymerase sigma factor [Chloracidobacterium sp.]